MYQYYPKGICPREIDIEVDGNAIKNVSFQGGCNGNLKAISKLIAGMDIDKYIEMFDGHSCGGRPTSCADQLAQALKEIKAQEA